MKELIVELKERSYPIVICENFEKISDYVRKKEINVWLLQIIMLQSFI